MSGIPFEDSNSPLTIGHPEIDRQHGEIFAQLASFSQLLQRKAELEEIAAAHFLLLFLFQDHFAYEERVMEEQWYPDLELHREEHRNFMREGREVLENLQRRDETEMEKLHEWWSGWAVMHVVRDDQKFGDFLRRSG